MNPLELRVVLGNMFGENQKADIVVCPCDEDLYPSNTPLGVTLAHMGCEALYTAIDEAAMDNGSRIGRTLALPGDKIGKIQAKHLILASEPRSGEPAKDAVYLSIVYQNILQQAVACKGTSLTMPLISATQLIDKRTSVVLANHAAPALQVELNHWATIPEMHQHLTTISIVVDDEDQLQRLQHSPEFKFPDHVEVSFTVEW